MPFLRIGLGAVMQIFPHRDIDIWRRVLMSRFNFYNDYLFGFEALIFATLQIVYMHTL